MVFRFDNKNVVVTGGSQGIGAAVAKAFAANGANVVIGDVKEEGCKKTVEEIRAAGGKADYIVCDITNVEQVNALMNFFDRLDVVIQVAGVALSDTLLHADQDKIQRLVNINLMGTSNVLRAAIDKMKDNGQGKIVTFCSMASRSYGDYTAHYRMTKAGTASITMSAADAAAQYNINVNGVAPGIVATDMWLKDNANYRQVAPGSEQAMDLTNQAAVRLCPLGRVQTVDDMANATMFLASDWAKNITGQVLNVDGGAIMQI